MHFQRHNLFLGQPVKNTMQFCKQTCTPEKNLQAARPSLFASRNTNVHLCSSFVMMIGDALSQFRQRFMLTFLYESAFLPKRN